MGKYKVIVDFDTNSGDYELEFKNVSKPGESMDYNMIKEALKRIFGDFIGQREGEINKKMDKRNDN